MATTFLIRKPIRVMVPKSTKAIAQKRRDSKFSPIKRPLKNATTRPVREIPAKSINRRSRSSISELFR